MKMIIKAEIPNNLLQEWLQYLRDFDTAHPECRFELAMESDRLTTDAVVDLLRRVEPGFASIIMVNRRSDERPE